MKDNINNNSVKLDMLKALNPNIKKDFNGDSTKSYSCSVVKEETNKDSELEVMLRLSSIPKRLDAKSKAAEEIIAYTKNTAALNDIFNKSQEDTERERECRIRFNISSIAKTIAKRVKLFKSKTVEFAVTGGNSSGAVITSSHVVTLEFNDLNSWLDFNKILRKTKFLKEAKAMEDGKLLYKFNIKAYDKHELNLNKSLSNFSDIFIGYYYNLCKERNIDFIDVNAISELATKLFDDEWCALDSIMY